MKHMDVLAKAYNELYLPTFPLSEGHQKIDRWLDSFGNPNDNLECHIIIAGDNIRSVADNTVIKSICVAMYYKDSNVGYLAYIAVDPQFRTEGLGKVVFNKFNDVMAAAAHSHGKTLDGLFLDCNDPAANHPDNYDPKKRIEKYKAWGGNVVPVDYVLPVACPPPEQIDHWVLISFPVPQTGAHADNQAVLKFLSDAYKDNGIVSPETNKYYINMKKELLGTAASNHKIVPKSNGPKAA